MRAEAPVIALAMASSLAFPGVAEACRIVTPRPPLSAAALERNANEGLVRNADAIAIAEITHRQNREGLDHVSFRPENVLRGPFPLEARAGEEMVITSCGPHGNNGSYPGAASGDRVILFLIQGTPIHAERLGTRRADALLSIIRRENP